MMNWLLKWGIVVSGLSAVYFWKMANPGKSLNPFGADVTIRGLQHVLNLCGASPVLRCDGVMGPQTRAAIRMFQQNWGLQPDGKLGPRTLQALQQCQRARARRASRRVVTAAGTDFNCGFGAET